MSYATILSTIFGKRPFWLYEFTRDGEVARFTSAGADREYGGNTYVSTPITHTRFMRTGSIGRAQTEIVLPGSSAWGLRYLDETYEGNTVTIYHGFANDPDEEVVIRFRGRVVGAQPRLTRITLLAENRLTKLRRKALPPVMQRPCRHALYGSGCGLDIANFETAGTLTGLTGNTATVAAAASQAAGYYSGGVLTYDGRRQMITRHSGSSLTLLGPIPGMAEDLGSAGSLAVQIAPGCTLSRQTCNDRFGNLANFGGFPWMVETPFDGKTLF